MGRFALYTDYKDLYNKVVPVTELGMRSIESVSQQVSQYEQILHRFD